MAASTWRSSQGSSQPPPGGSPSPSTRRFNSSKTTPLVSSMVSSSASTLFHSALTWLSRFSSDRSISPNCHGVAEKPGKDTILQQAQKRIRLCAPSTYPGFRCILHRKSSSGSSSSSSNRTAFGHNNDVKTSSSTTHAIQIPTATSNADRLTIRRFAMINLQARSGTVEEDFVKKALTVSSSQKQCRRKDFHRQRSRLSVMSKAEDS